MTLARHTHRWLGGLALAGTTTVAAWAHGAAETSGNAWKMWRPEAAPTAVVFLMLALYLGGLRALRRATGQSRKLGKETGWFALGWIALAIALLSPVHPLSSIFFAIHMTQHELLMVVAAPLIVLGRPMLVWLWAFPRRTTLPVISGARALHLGPVWHWSQNAAVAFLVHAVALWIWHAPVLFEAALRNEGLHALQHAMFFGTALLFWQSVFWGERRAADYGVAVLFLFLTALHSGALGALITFASKLWYSSYGARADSLTLTPLEDQQLGGLIMWIPAGLVYAIAGVVLFGAWLRESERRLTNRNSTIEGGRTCAPAS